MAGFAFLSAPTILDTENLRHLHPVRSHLLFQSRIEDEHGLSQMLITLQFMLIKKGIDLLRTLPKSS